MDEINLEQRLYVKNKEKWLKIFEKSYCLTEKAETKEIDDGIILPALPAPEGNFKGGACDKDFNFLGGLVYYPDKVGDQPYVYDSYFVPEEEIDYIDETVVFGGVLLNHPGHLARDSFASRLWWYVSNPDSTLKIAFITLWEDRKWGGTKHDFIKEFIDLLGIPDERVLFIERPTRFKKLLIPDQCIYAGAGFTDEYITVVDKIMSNVEEGNYDKVYFTKKLTEHNDFINEGYFCEFFKRKGYTIINPEECTLREKVSICKGAKEFACVNGTNSIYALFCKPDVKFFVLERVEGTPGISEAWINQARGISDFYSVNVSLSFLSDNFVWGIKLLGITDEWKSFVKDVYDEEITETTEDVLKEYSFEYLKSFAEYTAQPKIFEYFKGFDHFKILETMNRLFLGRTLDPKNYKIERLQDYKKQTTSYKEQISTSREVNVRQNEILEKLLFGILERLGSGMKIKIPGLKSLRSLIKPAFKYRVNYGEKWTGKVRDEAVAGSDGSKKPIVSFRIDPEENTPNMFYSVFTAEEGWTPDVHEGKASGSIKKALPVRGLRIRFDEATSELFSVRYRVFTHPKGWTSWVEDGKATPWRSCDMIDAVQIQVVQKEDYNEKADAICNKFFADLGKAIENGIQGLKDSETKDTAAEISALENKIAAQEYVIKSLENTLAAIVNNKKDED